MRHESESLRAGADVEGPEEPSDFDGACLAPNIKAGYGMRFCARHAGHEGEHDFGDVEGPSEPLRIRPIREAGPPATIRTVEDYLDDVRRRSGAAPATQEAPSAPAEPLEHAVREFERAVRFHEWCGNFNPSQEAQAKIEVEEARAALSVSTSAPKETSEPRRESHEIQVGGPSGTCRECGESRNDAREVHVCFAERDYLAQRMAEIKARRATPQPAEPRRIVPSREAAPPATIESVQAYLDDVRDHSGAEPAEPREETSLASGEGFLGEPAEAIGAANEALLPKAGEEAENDAPLTRPAAVADDLDLSGADARRAGFPAAISQEGQDGFGGGDGDHASVYAASPEKASFANPVAETGALSESEPWIPYRWSSVEHRYDTDGFVVRLKDFPSVYGCGDTQEEAFDWMLKAAADMCGALSAWLAEAEGTDRAAAPQDETLSPLEAQVREALAIIESGSDYERAHVAAILRNGLAALSTSPDGTPR